MKSVISLKDLQEMVRNGQDVRNLPADAILTPSARDLLLEMEIRGIKPSVPGSSGAGTSAPAKPLNSKSSKSELKCSSIRPTATI